MKKLFSLLIVFISIKCFGQVYQVLPQYGYEMKRVNATLVLLLPSDTITNKTGVARIGTVLYSGNGTKWTPATATDTTSLSNRINLKLNISDTAAMLTPYAKTILVNTKVNISDTAAMLSPYAKTSVVNSGLALKVNIADTAAMLTNYAKTSAVALKVNISDTAAMLANYAKTSAVNSAVALKVNIADTAAMLTPYLRKIDTASLSNRINLKADINSPTFTGTVGGITQSMVGLGNVTNESKATMFTNATFTGTFATAAGAIGNASLANGAVANLSGTNTGDQNLQSVTNLGATTTNSITANSLIKSGGTASQILAADGSVITAGNFITITGGQISSTSGASGGGSSVNYYLNGGTSQGTFSGSTYYEFSKTAVIGTGADFSRSSNGYIASFITDVADPSLLLIPAGNWNLEFFFSASSNGGSPSFYVELYKYDGTTFTSIASSSATPEGITNGTSIDAYFTALAVPETVLTVNDRLAIRVFVNASSRTITLHTQNGHLCEVITTFTSGLTALNGLQAQVQNFATGTSGTDFAISSSGSTHTFNLPDASAANRGALSSADWTAFNNKGSVSSIATDNTTGITGGTITTTGTLAIDTTVISTRKWRQKGIDSVQANLTTGLALKVNISDTSSMLSSYFRKVDTASLSNRINLKLNISDTSSMLSPYARTNSVNAGLALKVNISDTATMLSPYARKNFLNAGTGISYSSVTGTIGNTAPDQTVALTAGTGISTSGTYPNFTITNTSPSSGGTVTSVGLSSATSGVTIGATPVTTSGTITLAIATASGSQNGLLSSTDWTTFNGKESVLTFSSPLVRTTNTISIPVATTSVNGYLSSADWTTFNGKQGTITLTTTGTSGAATFSANTLNIPDYGSALSGYLPLTGGTLTGALSGTSASFSGNGSSFGSASAGSYPLTVQTNISEQSIKFIGKNDNNNIQFFNSANTVYQAVVGTIGTDFIIGTGTSGTTRFTIASTGAATFSGSVTSGSWFRIASGASNLGYFLKASDWGDTGSNPSIATETGLGFNIYTNGTTTPRLTIASTGAATFSSTIAAATESTFTGTSTNTRLLITASGVANTVIGFNNSGSTANGVINNAGYVGILQDYPFIITIADVERFRIAASTGAATFSSSVGGQNFESLRNGSASVSSQFQLSSISGTTYSANIQLGAAGSMDFWTYDAASLGWGKYLSIASTGAATFSGTLSTNAGFGILSGGGGYTIGPTATRGVIAINGSTDQLLTFSTQSYIYNSSSLFRMLSSSDIDFVAGGTQRLLISASTGAATFSSSVTATQGNFNQTATSGFAITMKNRNANQSWGLVVDADAVDDKIFGIYSDFGIVPFYALKLEASGGAATFSSSIKTAAPSGGTAKPFKIGAAATVTPTSQNRTIEIEIDGVTYYLTAKTTND